MTQTSNDVQTLTGGTAFDQRGKTIGRIGGIYLDEDSGQPEWAAVQADGDGVTLLPLSTASPVAGGIQVPFEAKHVRRAPFREPSLPEAISPLDEVALYRHYGLDRSSASGVQPPGPEPVKAAAPAAVPPPDTGPPPAPVPPPGRPRRTRPLSARGREPAPEPPPPPSPEAVPVEPEPAPEVEKASPWQPASARDLVGEARHEASRQVEDQTQRLAEVLRQLGAEARALAEGRPAEATTVAPWVAEAAQRLDGLASGVTDRGAEGLGADLHALARRRPTAFALGAAVAGLGVGRLLRAAGEDRPGGGAQ